jgi:hypothetical protein
MAGSSRPTISSKIKAPIPIPGIQFGGAVLGVAVAVGVVDEVTGKSVTVGVTVNVCVGSGVKVVVGVDVNVQVGGIWVAVAGLFPPPLLSGVGHSPPIVGSGVQPGSCARTEY